MKFATKVTGIGDMVEELAKDSNLLIVFNDDAPPELKEVSLQHTQAELSKEIAPGDLVRFGENEYTVTAVGSEANRTLKDLGHCTFKFNGAQETELPGDIELEANGKAPKIKVGDIFEVEFK